MFQRKCPVCGCEIAERLFKIDGLKDDTEYLPDDYDVVCCKKCGFCYANTKATLDEYEKYYSNSNFYGEEAGKRAVNDELFPIVFENIDRIGGKILDIGFGKGELLI